MASSPYDRYLFAAFLALIVWAPLPFASNRPWALALLAVLVMALTGAWALLHALNLASVPQKVVRRGRWPLMLLALVPLWALVQMIPLPRELVAILSPRAEYLHLPAERIPLTLDLAGTRRYLLAAIVCWGGFALSLALVNSAARAKALLWTLVASGSFQAIYGSTMVLTGLEWGFLVEKYTNRGVATGTFVNTNHLAGYLVMCLAAGTGLILAQLSSRSVSSLRDLLRRGLALVLSGKFMIRLLMVVMVIALVLSRSRMGNIAFFVSLAVAGAVAIYFGRRISLRLVVLIGSLFIIDLLILGQWFGLDALIERMETASPESQYRLEVQGRGASLLAHFPLTGSGGGSYHSVFTYYQSPDDFGFYRHAHNDYLQIAAEMGIPVLVALTLVALLVLRRALRMQRKDHSRLQQGVGFTLVMVLVWLALHSAVDFNLQIPANAFTVSILFGLAFANLLPERKRRQVAPGTDDRPLNHW